MAIGMYLIYEVWKGQCFNFPEIEPAHVSRSIWPLLSMHLARSIDLLLRLQPAAGDDKYLLYTVKSISSFYITNGTEFQKKKMALKYLNPFL